VLIIGKPLIKENPYYQYLLGLPCYQDEAPFEVSSLVHFRKRISKEMLQEINERIVKRQLEREKFVVFIAKRFRKFRFNLFCYSIIVRKRGVCDRDQVIEEPDEVKVSRPVLKPSSGGDPTA